jgi:protein-L-isoaspartate(D-aspartate) O-methyltransferase
MVQQGIIRTIAVERAFLATPREAFVPGPSPGEVYADTTIPISGRLGEWLTTSSQPTMMAIMLEQLDIRPGHRVLEIGSGTGYNAALLAHLSGAEGSVDSVEIDGEAAAAASTALARMGANARVHHADGADGWPAGAPYDRIIATVSIPDMPDAWAVQAATDAVIVAPLNILGCDYSSALHREGDDWLSSSIEACAFVRFQGRLAERERRLSVGDPDAPALALYAEAGQLPLSADVAQWLDAGVGEMLARLRGRSEWEAFALWLATRSQGLRVIRATSGGRGLGWSGPAVGVWDEGGMAFITPTGQFARFGAGSSAERLRAVFADWMNAGAPDLSRSRLRLRRGQIEGAGWLKRRCHSISFEKATEPKHC